ncbi:MAG: 2-hydroxyglutaryl-CoA dehydratase [Acutalibacteraceae bacterium]|nr:2-hydroxyglutaryl-CoA dehydratase [Acutalibacteraceae bacterium]
MAKLVYDKDGRLLFTKEMKKEYTILFPMMAKIHFHLMKNIFAKFGYKVALLETEGPEIAQVGLKYVHNDTCYPAILTIGQLIHAVESGKYDVNKIALLLTQTGGGCRASNYIHLLRKALIKAGYDKIPVISLNMSGMEKNPGFNISIPLLRRLAAAGLYGDLIMSLSNQVQPYEVNEGDTERMIAKWTKQLTIILSDGYGFKRKELAKYLDRIAEDFSKIEVKRTPKVKVGIVGEIYVKYASLGNNNLERFLREQDCEINVPGILGFAMFKVDNRLEDYKLYGGSKAKYVVVKALMDFLTDYETLVIESQERYGFRPITRYQHTKELVKGVVGYGSKMGEGWLLTGEMLELIECGFENIVCTQPFGCLPNHINGKGMIRRIKQKDERANIVAIDYDPGAPRVNQENRIKLMLAVAKEKLTEQTAQAATAETAVPVADVSADNTSEE